ncbi:MAG: cytidylate kinase family protein [Eubacterium sp.]|nr:cytidylate kinase family protein [Eubacterium sp.]
MDKVKRYLIFLVGLFVSSLGVSLITKANLGTSPISSIPYVLSLNFPLTLGNFTILFSVFLILLQLGILRKNFKAEHLLQVPISILFGYFIDMTMAFLFFVHPQSYLLKVVYLLIGCLILAIGVYAEVLANVAMLPGESFVRAIVETWHRDFGTTKVVFDVSMTVTAAVLSFIFVHRLEGVREGTIVAALLVGFLARILGHRLAFLERLLFPEDHKVKMAESAAVAKPAAKNVIVIGRQYGSGGSELGQLLAKRLCFACYDEEIIQLTAGTTGYTPEFVRRQEEMMTNSLLFDMVNQMYAYAPNQEAPKDQIFDAEAAVIQELSQEGSCVIIGRCSDYILKNDPHCLRVFFHAPLESRVRRVMERENLSEKEARAKVQKEDRWRADNYRYYTRQIWGMAGNYNLTLDTDLGIDYIEHAIREALKIESGESK